MKVLLKADVKGTGKKDQLVEVSDGYARNFLFPRKLAVEANSAAVNEANTKASAKQHKLDVELQQAKQTAEKISGKSITINAKAGNGGRLFGAVTAKDIADIVESTYKIELDKRKIVLDSDIKNYGSYEVTVKIYPNITAKLTVNVQE